MNALFLVLGIPLLGGLALALTGHRAWARDVNVAFSLGTFVAACFMTAQVINEGPEFVWDKLFTSTRSTYFWSRSPPLSA